MSIESDMHLSFEVPGKLKVEMINSQVLITLIDATTYGKRDEERSWKPFSPSELKPLSRMLNRMIKHLEQKEGQK